MSRFAAVDPGKLDRQLVVEPHRDLVARVVALDLNIGGAQADIGDPLDIGDEVLPQKIDRPISGDRAVGDAARSLRDPELEQPNRNERRTGITHGGEQRHRDQFSDRAQTELRSSPQFHVLILRRSLLEGNAQCSLCEEGKIHESVAVEVADADRIG